MTLLKLTPQNQLRRLYEDIERLNGGGKMDFSIGQHIELLIKRVAALEAQGIEARQGQDRETGLGRNDESPVLKGCAQNEPD